MSILEHMCPICENYMPLEAGRLPTSVGALQQAEEEVGANQKDLIRSCRNCGYTQAEKKGLVMETIIQEKESEAYRVSLNEFTKEDPRLPHVKNLKCPNTTSCPTRIAGEESDVIYIKYDSANLKFLYICTKCNTQWRSKS